MLVLLISGANTREPNNTMKTCEWCENTGVTTVANSFDDFDTEYCSCPEGSIKMQNDEIRVAIRNLGKSMRYA